MREPAAQRGVRRTVEPASRRAARRCARRAQTPSEAEGDGVSGEPCRTRTYNLEIKSLLLYQLS